MADTFTPGMRLQQMTTGADNDTWGSILDTDLLLIDAAVAGYSTINVGGMISYTLTAANGQPDQARSPAWVFSGALTADCYVAIPPVARVCRALNNTTGGFRIILYCSGTGTQLGFVNDGSQVIVWCDGTNVYKQGLIAANVIADNWDAGGGGGQFRAIAGNYGSILRNDGTSTYLLVTAAGTPYGTYNGLRPFAFNNATGGVSLDGTGAGTYMGGSAVVEGPLTVVGNGGSFYSSFANPGFNYAPLGLLTQRGFVTTGGSGPSLGVATINFPIPFSGAILNLQATVNSQAAGDTANVQYVSLSQFVLRTAENTSNVGGFPVQRDAWWMAEGY